MGTKLKNARILSGLLDSERNNVSLNFVCSNDLISEPKAYNFAIDLFGLTAATVLYDHSMYKLTMQVLLRLIMDFEDMLKVGSWDHIIIRRIVNVAQGYGWSKKLIQLWSRETKVKFIMDNALSMDLAPLSEDVAEKFFIPYCMVASNLHTVRMEYNVVSAQLAEMKGKQLELITQAKEQAQTAESTSLSVQENFKLLQEIKFLLQKIPTEKPPEPPVSEIETKTSLSKSEMKDSPKQRPVILSPFSLAASKGNGPSVAQLNGQTGYPSDLNTLVNFSMKDVFVRWFLEDLEVRSIGRERTTFNDLRTVVHVMYNAAEEKELQIGKRPPFRGEVFNTWKHRLMTLSEILQKRVLDILGKHRSSVSISSDSKSKPSDDGKVTKKRKISKLRPNVAANARRILKCQKDGHIPPCNYSKRLVLHEVTDSQSLQL